MALRSLDERISDNSYPVNMAIRDVLIRAAPFPRMQCIEI
jgi:hypothetical protein